MIHLKYLVHILYKKYDDACLNLRLNFPPTILTKRGTF